MPYAVCRYYNKNIPLWHAIILILSIFSFVPVANAACNAVNPVATLRAFISPEDFASMPNGSIVGQAEAGEFNVTCQLVEDNYTKQVNTLTHPPSGMKRVSGVTINSFHGLGGLSRVYTVPELEERGLGYFFDHIVFRQRVRCHYYGERPPVETYWFSFFNESKPPSWDMTVQRSSLGYVFTCSNANSSNYRIYYSSGIFLVKIGDASQHEALPQDFTTAPLFGASFRVDGVTKASWTISLSVTNFASRVAARTCTTPIASESVIDFGLLNYQQIQQMTPGQGGTPREFQFTFTCPHGAYERISFFVEPKHGTVAQSGYTGVMKIAQGAGMAQGVGVRLEEYGFRSSGSWLPVIYRADPLSNAGDGVNAGKYPLVGSRITVDNPLTEPPKPYVLQFRASLVRLPEPVVGGQIKAAALIHIRYN